jgi:hypothetical protein
MTSIAKTAVTRAEAAELFGIKSDELKPIFTRSRIPLSEVVKAHITRISTPPETVVELREETTETKVAFLNASSEVRELRAELIDGRSYRSSDIERIVGARLSALTGKLLNLGPKCALRLVGQTRETMESVIGEELKEAIAELVPYDGRSFRCSKLYLESDGEEGNDG